MSTSSEKKKIIVAVDIEKTGCLFAHPVNSVGFYIAHEVENPKELKSDEVETFKWNISVNWPLMEEGKIINYGDFEPECWNEFWNKQPRAAERCLFDPLPIPASKAWTEIGQMIDNLEKKYPEDKYKLVFISDNASFDIATINYNLEKYASRKPMRYSTKGKWRAVVSHKDVFYAMPIDVQKTQLAVISKEANHDHDPVNDAHYHYLMHISTKFPNRKFVD